MEKERKSHVAHCLVLPYPLQGHINPMLQFSKRLVQRGVKVTLANTVSIWNTISNINLTSIEIESISDGYDEGGLAAAGSIDVYKETFWRIGPQTLDQLLQKLANSNNPVDCVIHDAFLPWALDVAKSFGIQVAVFLTQACSVNNINFHAFKKFLELPLSQTEILLPGLPKLAPKDLPSFLYKYGSTPGYFDILLNQFSRIDKADWVLVNTFYELEPEVVDWLGKLWPLKTIGPSLPSMFLDKRLKDDKDYDISIFSPNIEDWIKWLDDKPKDSVVYVSFGSLAGLSVEQTEELAWGLKDCGSYFIWVVRDSEKDKLPKEFLDTSEKGLIVTWCHQLQVLTHEAVGCFVTHCGWNSTLEALCVGVPVIAMPVWTDQITNAKLIIDVWKMGLKAVVDEKEIVRRETIKDCIKEIMENEKGNEIKNNAIKWKKLAKNAIDEGGSSDKNIAEFVAKLAHC
ncbi:mogroside IE synthase-like [Gastrolobium bilobum]|uniref:mogroside IE synthase-like n=1 Tax=Gastrolobium bilobum TaxID=150636 RepID=UPI002AB15B3C|nr:mogroside IE synthase-like [Gastrolobium bilobum]